MRRNLRLTVTMVALGLALAACGGSPDGDRVASLSGAGATGTTNAPANGATRDPEQAALAFARCMRAHGVDMADPKVDDQGRTQIRIGGGGAKPDPRKLEAAQKACGTRFGGDGPGKLDPRARDAMVDYARCMREHGIDMPDPTGDGGLVIRKRAGQGKGDGPDPESAAFQAADRACAHHLNAIGRPGASGARS